MIGASQGRLGFVTVTLAVSRSALRPRVDSEPGRWGVVFAGTGGERIDHALSLVGYPVRCGRLETVRRREGFDAVAVTEVLPRDVRRDF